MKLFRDDSRAFASASLSGCASIKARTQICSANTRARVLNATSSMDSSLVVAGGVVLPAYHQGESTLSGAAVCHGR